MKKIILLTLSLIAIFTLSAYSQNWNAVDFPLIENINGIKFVGQDTAFLITNQGTLLRSFDRLNSFDIFQPDPNVPLEDVDFINSKVGFICGPKGTLMKTTDAGYTFNALHITDTIPWFFDVEMFDAQHGMVVGMTRSKESPLQGLAFRTDDGGKSWKKLKPMGLGYSELCYHDNTIYLVSYGKINYSTDFGKTWKSTNTVEGSPGRCISFFGKNAVIGGIQGMCAYSSDDGKTWLPSQQDNQLMFIANQMVSNNDAYMGGTKSTLLKSSDGGKSWNPELMAKSFDIFDMALSGDRLYVVGSDGGIIWKKVK